MTDARPSIPAGLLEGGVVAIARNLTDATVRDVADGLLRGGVRAFELTLNEPEATALVALRAAARHADGTPLEIGAGTVLTIEAAERAVDAGATFLVSPHVDPELIEWAADRGIPFMPGRLHPHRDPRRLACRRPGREALSGLGRGSRLHPRLPRPVPAHPAAPDGRRDRETAPDFIRAGAIAVGLGSWLIGDGDPAGITTRASGVVRAVEDCARTAQRLTGLGDLRDPAGALGVEAAGDRQVQREELAGHDRHDRHQPLREARRQSK